MKTVRVRIAVAVNERGQWRADGGGWFDGATPRYESPSWGDRTPEVDGPPETVHVVFVEADVPVPEPVTVEGNVKP